MTSARRWTGGCPEAETGAPACRVGWCVFHDQPCRTLLFQCEQLIFLLKCDIKLFIKLYQVNFYCFIKLFRLFTVNMSSGTELRTRVGSRRSRTVCRRVWRWCPCVTLVCPCFLTDPTNACSSVLHYRNNKGLVASWQCHDYKAARLENPY